MPNVQFTERYSRQILYPGIGTEEQHKLELSHVAKVHSNNLLLRFERSDYVIAVLASGRALILGTTDITQGPAACMSASSAPDTFRQALHWQPFAPNRLPIKNTKIHAANGLP